MINEDRIVPVTDTDLLSLYAKLLVVATSGAAVAVEPKAIAELEVNSTNLESATGVGLCTEPVKTLAIDDTVTDGAVIWFVPAYDFEYVSYDGAVVAEADDLERVDPSELYLVEIDSGAATVSKFGF